MLGYGGTTPQDYPERTALLGDESVSVVTVGTVPTQQETPPMRIYIISNDGITLCGEPPAAVNEGEIVASNEELHAARISAKRLLALWSALPDVEKRSKVGDREALIDHDAHRVDFPSGCFGTP
jgi:hypothetical protein